MFTQVSKLPFRKFPVSCKSALPLRKFPVSCKSSQSVTKVPNSSYKSALSVTKVPDSSYKSALIWVTKVPYRYKSSLLRYESALWTLRKFPFRVTKVPFPLVPSPSLSLYRWSGHFVNLDLSNAWKRPFLQFKPRFFCFMRAHIVTIMASKDQYATSKLSLLGLSRTIKRQMRAFI